MTTPSAGAAPNDKAAAAEPPRRPTWLEAGSKPTPIRIRELRFARPNGLEVPIPGPHGGRLSQIASLAAGRQQNSEAECEITLVPWLRRYVIVYKPSPKESPLTFTIPESWALDIPEME